MMAGMEKQRSFRQVAMEKQRSFRIAAMEKQKSFKMKAMERQQSFWERRKNIDSPGKRGDTPLHLASRAGNLLLVNEILSDGVEISRLKDLIMAQNLDGQTALYVASENGHVEVVCEILKHSDAQSAALIANNSFDSLHVAAKQGHVAVLRELLSSFPELAMTTNSSNATALDTASTQGHIGVVNLLLETDASLAKIARNNGKTALHSAARMGHVEVVKSLLSKDPSICLRTDKKGQTAFHMAVKGQNVEIVEELLKHDISVINLEDNKANTPLHIATRKGRSLILQSLLCIEGIDVNAVNKAGQTALDIAEKSGNEVILGILKETGAVAAKDLENPPSPVKQLNKTVSDIKHGVQSQLQQTRQTGMRVQKIKKRLKKLHTGGLNNAINSNTVVAVLIATIAFAAIFTLPGQYAQDKDKVDGYTVGQAYIATNAAFVIFFIFDSLALFISLGVVVVQISIIVTERKAKELMVFVMNKLMWLACICISVSFISLTYIVVGRIDCWLAWCTTAIGASIMLTTLGSMCYCIFLHRMDQKNLRNVRKASRSQSRTWSVQVSDSELYNSERRMYAL